MTKLNAMATLAAPVGGAKTNYFKPAKGDNRLRILSIDAGFEAWVRKADTNTPHRQREEFTPEDLVELGAEEQKQIYIAHVWDYAKDKDMCWSISQLTIRKEIFGLIQNPDWGDLSSYDLSIKKSGDGLDTEYIVTPIPPKKFAFAKDLRLFDLEQLFNGKDPFEDAVPV